MRLIAGGVNTLDPFPITMPLEELESALRFVSDPEDAALLQRWFRFVCIRPHRNRAPSTPHLLHMHVLRPFLLQLFPLPLLPYFGFEYPILKT